MPNGRSGGFPLKRGELEQLLDECDEKAQVGLTALRKPVTAGDVREILSHFKGDSIPVEEQDRSWYTVQFGEDGSEWIVVGSKSPLLAGCRHYHEEWRKEWAKKHRGP